MTQPANAPASPITPASNGFSADVIAEVFGPVDDATAVTETSVETTEADKAATEEPKAPGVSGRIVAAKRAEQRAAAQRTESESRKRQLDEQKATQDAREAELKLIEEDPAKYFELKKLGPKAIADHLERLAGTFKPEAVADKKISEQDQRIKDLEEKLAAKETAERTAHQTAAQRHAEAEAGKAFIADVAASADKYVYLTQEFTEEQAVATAFAELNTVLGKDAAGNPVTRLQAYIAQHGEPPSHEIIAEHLNSIAQQRIEARSKASWRKAGDAPDTAGQASHGDLKIVPPVKGTSPRTLSARDTSQRAAAPRTKGNVWTAEDQAEADEASMRILAGAYRKL